MMVREIPLVLHNDLQPSPCLDTNEKLEMVTLSAIMSSVNDRLYMSLPLFSAELHFHFGWPVVQLLVHVARFPSVGR